jgi:hypothetical protein
VGNPSNGSVAYDPTTQTVGFVPTTGYTGPASFIYTITDGRGDTDSANVSLTVDVARTASLFASSDTPATVTVKDPAPAELGVKFRASADGTITGIRFYKGLGNTGPHIGDLWTANGTLLASATFTGESASGWQQANFATTVPITAGTTYVASYHTSGFYSADANYYNNTVTNGPLTAPSSGTSGGNGVYIYSASHAFPTHAFQASNYWVDVAFDPSAPNAAPVANADGGFITAPHTAMTLSAATLLANDTDPEGNSLTVTSVSAPTNGTVSFANNIVTFTPTADFTGLANFTYSISDGQKTASAQVSLEVANSLWGNADTPAVVTENDPGAASLGLKFTASSAGTITGIRFYKGPQNTGTHVVDLWSTTGTKLATATATNETASGWQEADFTSPVSITAGTTYIAAYHTNTGFYSANTNYFASAHTSGPLTAPSSGTSGGNGVYAYSAGDTFPANTFKASNYWVDPVFQPLLTS